MSKHDIEPVPSNPELGYCTVCGGSEGELPTDCPGYTMNYAERQAVFKGGVDFVNGEWEDRPKIRYKQEATFGKLPEEKKKALQSLSGELEFLNNTIDPGREVEAQQSFSFSIEGSKEAVQSIRELYEHEPELFFKLLVDGAPSGYRGIIKDIPGVIRNLKYWINPKDWAGLDMFTDEMEEADELAQRALDFMKRVKL